MSKLEKALEMAQQARGEDSPASETTKETTPVTPAPQKTQAEDTPKVKTACAARPGHIEPVYTQTRVTPADKAVLEKHGILTTDCPEIIIEQYNLLRVKIETAMKENDARSIMVCSPGPKEGKTITAINLAISIARETSRTVLLVDADMRKPAIHKYMGIEAEAGLFEHLTKGTPLNELLINPGIPRLTILTAGTPSDYPADLLGSPAMHDFVTDIKNRYPERLVIFDSPPLNLFSDGLYLARYADTALMVVRSCKSKEEELDKAMEEISHTNLLGIALNRVPARYCPSYDYRGY